MYSNPSQTNLDKKNSSGYLSPTNTSLSTLMVGRASYEPGRASSYSDPARKLHRR
jgi:hypothetical protein